MALLSPDPVMRFYDNNNNPLVGGQLFTYQAGTATPAATYTDSTGLTQNTNPVILNARGEANIWLLAGQAYKFILKDSLANTIWTVDNINPAPNTGVVNSLTNVTGTNTITALCSGIQQYSSGTVFSGVAQNTNTGAATINIDGLGPVNIVANNLTLVGGELAAGVAFMIEYDGTNMQLLNTNLVNAYSGITRTFGAPNTALSREIRDVLNITGMQYSGSNINIEFGIVNNTTYNTATNSWAGRDVAGPCFAEVMTEAGQKIYYYAATAAAGVAPSWTLMFSFDLSTGAASIFNTGKSQVFTVSGTYTPTAGMKWCRVRAVGGGGAGGGTLSTGSGQAAVASGGNAGAYAEVTLTAAQVGVSQTVTIGAGGTGVAGANGGNGSPTTFGSLLSAAGGNGGVAGGATTQDTVTTNATSTSTVGDIKGSTPIAQPGIVLNTSAFSSGDGANSMFGAGGNGTHNGSGTPGSGGQGGGGAGMSSGASQPTKAGANGGNGLLIVEEYFI